jgi:hypothetical protein
VDREDGFAVLRIPINDLAVKPPSQVESLLTDLDLFRARTAEAEYTDTGEAWEMIDKLEAALREAIEK